MRVPQIENYSEIKGNYKVKIPKIEKCDMHVNLVTDKDRVKFIKDCERIIRGSMEYRDYINYVKEFKGMDRCKIMQNLPKNVRKEVHHEPFTLFDITNVVVNKFIREGNELNYFHVANEVMKLHYQNKVGLITLSLTSHKLLHAGKIFIPLQWVEPGFLRFCREYEQDIPEELMNMLKEKLKISREIFNGDRKHDLSILDKHYIYIEQDGVEVPFLVEGRDE